VLAAIAHRDPGQGHQALTERCCKFVYPQLNVREADAERVVDRGAQPDPAATSHSQVSKRRAPSASSKVSGPVHVADHRSTNGGSSVSVIAPDA